MRAHGVLLSLLLLSPGDAQLWTAAIAGTANASGAINAVDSNSSFAYPTGAAEVRTATSSTTLSAIVADAGNNLLRGLRLQMSSTPINGAALSLYMASAVSTVAGNGTAGFADGYGTACTTRVMFSRPWGISTFPLDVTSSKYLIWVADTGNHAVRGVSWTPGAAVTSANRRVSTLTGSGIFGNADTAAASWTMTRTAATAGVTFGSLAGIASTGLVAFVVDTHFHRVRAVITQNNSNEPIARCSTTSFSASGTKAGTGTPVATTSTLPCATPYAALGPYPNPALRPVLQSGGYGLGYIEAGASFAVAGGGGSLAQAGSAASNGAGSAALFSSPTGIAWDGNASAAAAFTWTLYVADTGNSAIRRIVASMRRDPAEPPSFSATTTIIAGGGGDGATAGYANGAGTAALFSSPQGVTASGTLLFVADSGNNVIRRIDLAGNGTPAAVSVSTYAGAAAAPTIGAANGYDADGSHASFNAPTGILMASQGFVVTVDTNNDQLRASFPVLDPSPTESCSSSAMPSASASVMASESNSPSPSPSQEGITSTPPSIIASMTPSTSTSTSPSQSPSLSR